MTGIIDRLQETVGRAQAGEFSERMPEKEAGQLVKEQPGEGIKPIVGR